MKNIQKRGKKKSTYTHTHTHTHIHTHNAVSYVAGPDPGVIEGRRLHRSCAGEEVPALDVSDMLNLDNLLMTIIINHELNTRNFPVVLKILKL